MDTEFHECLKERFTKAKKEYRFGNWTPEEGPSITTLETDGGDAIQYERAAKGRPERARR
jgi:hypothetical protein